VGTRISFPEGKAACARGWPMIFMLRMSGAIPTLPPYVFIECTWTSPCTIKPIFRLTGWYRLIQLNHKVSRIKVLCNPFPLLREYVIMSPLTISEMPVTIVMQQGSKTTTNFLDIYIIITTEISMTSWYFQVIKTKRMKWTGHVTHESQQ
jgi:hypothetical protein